MDNETLLLSKSDIEKCVDLREALQTVEDVFCAHGAGETVMPAKITLDLKGKGVDAWTNAMPGYVRTYDVAGIKWAGGYGANREQGLPYIMAMIILHDPASGVPLAVMDGTHITNLRTGASAAIGAKYFARSSAKVLGIIGAGVQGRGALEGTFLKLGMTEVKVYDINWEASNRFAKEMSGLLGIRIQPVHSAEEAVSETDIIITATTARDDLVKSKCLSPGSLVIALGSYREFDEATCLTADKIVVDNWVQCTHRSGLVEFVERGQISRDSIYAEFGDIVAGKLPGRGLAEEKILCVFIGLGTHDLALAKRAYLRAQQLGYGTRFSFT